MSLVFGAIYDSHAADTEDGKCHDGQDCYVWAFYINCITVSTAVLVAIFFSLRKK